MVLQLEPPLEKAEASGGELAQALQRASAAQKIIDRAQRKRGKAYEKAKVDHESKVRRWDNTRLQCRDGTRSPSCVCGGPERGCCSSHGGVAGCPKDYPEAPVLDTSPLVPNEFAGAIEQL